MKCIAFVGKRLSDSSYLRIERIFLQLIHTLELMSVTLSHYQSVLVSFVEVSLVQHLVSTSGEVPLPPDVDISSPLNTASKSSCFLLVGVEIDNQRKPYCVDFIL